MSEQELEIIASDPDETHIFRVDDFDGLDEVMRDLQQGTCVPTLPTTEPTTQPTIYLGTVSVRECQSLTVCYQNKKMLYKLHIGHYMVFQAIYTGNYMKFRALSTT